MLARSRYSLHSPVCTPPRAYTHSDSCVSLLTLDEILLRSALDRTGLSANRTLDRASPAWPMYGQNAKASHSQVTTEIRVLWLSGLCANSLPW